ncbi:MAG TPA: ABC transporter transmembrane domain-containing protein, partial [Chloroflexota bacterium]|nr:ABC transporter transmembrane domain-containing protein [Chloroflexota bacterium]
MNTLLRLIRDAMVHRSIFARAVAAQAAQIFFTLSLPFVIKQAIDYGLTAQNLAVLIVAAIATIILTLLRAWVWYTVSYAFHSLSTIVSVNLRQRVYDKLQRSSFAFLTRAQSGDLFAHGSVDVTSVEQFLNMGVRGILNLTILTCLLTVALFWLDSSLALIAIPVVPIVAILSIIYAPLARERSRRRQHLYGQMTAHLQENLTGMRVVKAFAAENREIQKFSLMVDDVYEASVRAGKLNALVFPTMTLATSIGIAAVLWVGGGRVIDGDLTLGGLVAFVAYLTLLVAPIRGLGETINIITEAVAGAERSYRLIDSRAVAETPEEAATKPDLPPVVGQVTLENVSFGYRAGESAAVLRDISFDVQPGKTLGIVGLTGAGKTSLAQLIGRFYEPTAGAVRIDGTDIRDVNLRSLRRQIGLVFQDAFLFSSSIHGNIALGRPDATREEVIAAADAACLHDFIVTMPQGYETELGERGITLSGGQRQRLALARALLIEPRILILDDTTSALDPVTAAEVWRRVTERRSGLTTIVIAQRLSAVRDADQTVVVDGGRIVERGNHNQLVRSDGLYSRLWEQQEAQSGDVIDHEKLLEAPDVAHHAAVADALPPQATIVSANGKGKVDVLALNEDDAVVGKPYDHNMMIRLLSYMRPFRLLIALTLVTMAVSSIASLANPYFQRLIIDFAIALNDPLAGREALRTFTLLFVVAAFVQWSFGMAYQYLMARAAYEMLRAIRRDIFVHCQRLSLSFYDRYKVGRLMSIMTGDVGAISNFLSTGLVATSADIFVLIGVVIALLIMNPNLALVTFLILPVIAYASHQLSSRSRQSYREVRRWSSTANGALAECIAGSRVTQAYVREDVNLDYYGGLTGNLKTSMLRAARITALYGPTMDTISSVVTAIVLSYGGYLVLQGNLTTGALVAFLAYTTRFFEPIRDLSLRYNALQAAMAGAERIFALLDIQPIVVDEPGARLLPPAR